MTITGLRLRVLTVDLLIEEAAAPSTGYGDRCVVHTRPARLTVAARRRPLIPATTERSGAGRRLTGGRTGLRVRWPIANAVLAAQQRIADRELIRPRIEAAHVVG